MCAVTGYFQVCMYFHRSSSSHEQHYEETLLTDSSAFQKDNTQIKLLTQHANTAAHMEALMFPVDQIQDLTVACQSCFPTHVPQLPSYETQGQAEANGLQISHPHTAPELGLDGQRDLGPRKQQSLRNHT